MFQIRFYNESIRFTIKHPRKISSWLKSIAKSGGADSLELTYIFCSDQYLWQLNKSYLQHDTLTDIITFDYSEKKALVGEIYISIDRVRENASKFEVSLDQELNRVVVHGLLHLLGFKDKTKAQKLLMRKKEDACLSLLANL